MRSNCCVSTILYVYMDGIEMERRTCNECATFTCRDLPSNSAPTKKGVSGGAVAGAVIGSLIMVALAVGLFLWYRKRSRAVTTPAAPKEKVAEALDVLNRPDPHKEAIEHAAAQAALEAQTREIQARPSTRTSVSRFVEHTQYEASGQQARNSPVSQIQSQIPTRPNLPAWNSNQSNPFSDGQSIITTATGDPESVPIALVPRTPGGHSVQSSEPSRPARPEQDLNLAHLNVSKDTMQYDSDRSLGRNSYMSALTTATDLMNEAPVIVTQSQRQVLGVSKAEVFRTPPSPATPMTGDSLRAHPPSMASRPSMRSPLAATSFGPGDTLSEADESVRSDPFDDSHSPYLMSPYQGERERPTSMATVATGAGTIIADISSAKRVNIGLARSSSVKSSEMARQLHRMTSGKLVSPALSQEGDSAIPDMPSGYLQQQQQRALAVAQAKAREQGGPSLNRRVSDASVMTNSTRADSILESFPFVPPSPISDRPMRTPPRSPLVQSFVSTPGLVDPSMRQPRAEPTPAQSRAQLGMSQISTASSGLGNFDFQIAEDAPPTPMPPSSFRAHAASNPPNKQGQRASLDTLALTSALSSYPLGFEDADAQFPPSTSK